MPVTDVKVLLRAPMAATTTDILWQMMHSGPWGKAGTLIPIQLDQDDKPATIKAKLSPITGIPAADMKLMLGAFTQICVGDKRTSLRFGTCGVTEGLGLTYEVRCHFSRLSLLLASM